MLRKELPEDMPFHLTKEERDAIIARWHPDNWDDDLELLFSKMRPLFDRALCKGMDAPYYIGYGDAFVLAYNVTKPVMPFTTFLSLAAVSYQRAKDIDA